MKQPVVSNAEEFVLVHEESFKKLSWATNVTPFRHIQDLNPVNRELLAGFMQGPHQLSIMRF